MNFDVPSFEGSPSPEGEVSRQEAVEAFRAFRGGDIEAKETFLKFVDEQEGKANEANNSLANIECSVELARIYFEAGFKEEALEELENSRIAAYQEHDSELISHIESLVDDIGRSNLPAQ